jgi:hypothetical protein
MFPRELKQRVFYDPGVGTIGTSDEWPRFKQNAKGGSATGFGLARFSDAGDSGSLILERATKQAVGLLFAGSGSHTVANHIGDVLAAFDVALA